MYLTFAVYLILPLLSVLKLFAMSLNTESLKSSELQKNLPPTDPAAQSTFLSQTAMLIEHYQLNHFSAAIDEVLCHLHQQSSIIQPASPASKTKPSNAGITGTALLAPLVLKPDVLSWRYTMALRVTAEDFCYNAASLNSCKHL